MSADQQTNVPNSSPNEAIIRVGERRIFFETTLMVLDDEPAEVDLPLAGNLRAKIILVFKSEPKDQQGSVSWRAEGETLRFEFIGWNNALGAAIRSAQKIGVVNNEQLGFQAVQHKIGALNLVHFQLLLGGTYA